MGLKAFIYKESEAELQEKVIQLAKYTGWKVAHFRNVKVLKADGTIRYQVPVQQDGEGFPDLVLVKNKVVWMELKNQKRKMTPEQIEWMDTLRNAGQEIYLFRPSDWESIERLLIGG